MFIKLEESAVAMSLLGSSELILLGDVRGWLETVWLTCDGRSIQWRSFGKGRQHFTNFQLAIVKRVRP